MKKLGRKLILSAVALGAVATTAVSTTFAWYVSNDTVSSNAITGKTESAASDALQISLDGAEWKTKVTPIDSDNSFQPVAYNSSAKKYYLMDGTTEVDANSSSVLHFSLYFRNLSAATGTKLYMKAFNLQNTTSKYTNLPLLADLTTTIKQNTTYNVDLLRTLRANITVTPITVTNAGEQASDGTSGTAATTGYTLSGYHNKDVQGYQADTLDETDATGYNAHTYYNTVKGLSSGNTGYIDTTDSDGNADDSATNMYNTIGNYIDLGTCNGTTYVKVDFVIYESGWSLACFDAVKAQTISLAMDFTSTAKSGN